jgi:CRISPR/Cas system-associated protein Cas7 (RAMP superfamily)
MKKFIITEEERNSILNQHIKATKRQYLKEEFSQGMTTIERYNYNMAIQCFLNKKGVKDDAGQPLKIDGSIGNYPKSKSAQAIAKYQSMLKVYPVDGVWGEDTMDAMPEKDKVIFKQCVSDYGDLYDKIIHYFGWD